MLNWEHRKQGQQKEDGLEYAIQYLVECFLQSIFRFLRQQVYEPVIL